MFELSAKSKKETDLLMYGSISDWGKVRAEDFIKNLSEIKAKGYERVNLKINSPGGSITEGIAIISQMGTRDLHITGIVEGMAASMMSVVLQRCHKRKMVKGTMMMIHQGAGGVVGSANFIRNYADLLHSMNKIIADIFASTTKKSAEWILENWMPEGKDTWFTAEKALAEGLIDEIIPGNVVPLEKENATLVEMAAHYNQFTDTKEELMNKEQLIKIFGLKADATDAEVQAAVEAAAKLKPVEAAPAAKTAEQPSAEKTQMIEGVAALAKERGADEKLVATIKKIAALDFTAAMEMIPAAKVETAADAKETTTPPSVSTVLNALNAGGKIKEANADTKTWGWDEWTKHPKEFEALLKNKPEEYAKVFKAEFNYEPKLDELKGVTN